MSWFANRVRPQQDPGWDTAESEAREPVEHRKPAATAPLPVEAIAETDIWQRPAEGPVWPPLVATDATGARRGGAGLDRLFLDDDVLILTGWTCGAATISLSSEGRLVPPVVRVEVERPDVASAYAFSNPVRGFLCLWRAPFPKGAELLAEVGAGRRKSVALQSFPSSDLEPDLNRILLEYAAARGGLFDALRDRPDLTRTIAWSAVHSAQPGGPRGHIDIMKAVADAGGLCVGWSLGRADFFLVDDTGACQELSGALRWNRPDIVEGFSPDYGAECAEAGFLQALAPTAKQGTIVRLIARTGDDLILIHERLAEPAPLDAVGYARWAFALPVPPERMVERFASHDGEVLRRLVARSRQHGKSELVVRRIGPVPEAPDVSLLIPLYGRFDFVDHQLLEFTDDPFIKERCEVLYVVDDPNIAQPVLSSLDRWWQLFRVPVTLAWGGRNRGFSGANNLGLSVARGRKVLFLNSDVIPRTPGWLEALSERLDDNGDFGLLAPRLIFPSGGLQHDGMAFEFEPNLGVWINDHPGKGLPAPKASVGSIIERPAATGACLLGRREDLLKIGGFSEIFLIGDFEDSDLCLKFRRAGWKIGVCPDIELTHLERQSFGIIGSGEFRARVMLFNAWQHQDLWGKTLEELSGESWVE